MIPDDAPEAFVDEINSAFDYTDTEKKLKFYDSLPSSCSYETSGRKLKFDSKAERQVGLLLEKVIPEYKLETNKTFQKKSKGSKIIYDFVIPQEFTTSNTNIIIEYHPMYWETLKKGNEGKTEETLRREYLETRSKDTHHQIILLEKCPLDMSEFAENLKKHLPMFANTENTETMLKSVMEDIEIYEDQLDDEAEKGKSKNTVNKSVGRTLHKVKKVIRNNKKPLKKAA